MVFGRNCGAFRVGLRWGMGHGLGTLLIALPLLWLASSTSLDSASLWGERLSGVALMLTGFWSLCSRAPSAADEAPHGTGRAPFVVGLVHGVTGAAALLLMLPMVLGGSATLRWYYLGAFAIGSAIAMAGLTTVMGYLGTRARHLPWTTWIPRVFQVVSIVWGAVWFVTA
jgi:nickel/cobalt exporter